jgi:DedD protein
MVLDDRSGQKTPQPEISISIPSQDGADFTSKIVPVSPPADKSAPVSIASPVEKPAEIPAPAPKPAEAKPAAPAVEPAEKIPAANTPAPAKETSPAKAETSKPVPADNKNKQAEVPAAFKKGSISVQIGVFSDVAKVKQMRAKIAEKGIQCYTENMDTSKGTKYRVRCGPFSDKPAAQQALESLKAAGYNGILVTNQ